MAQYAQEDITGALVASTVQIGNTVLQPKASAANVVQFVKSKDPNTTTVEVYVPSTGDFSSVSADQLGAARRLYLGAGVPAQAICGLGTLASGRCTISSTAITTNSLIFITRFNAQASIPCPNPLAGAFGSQLSVSAKVVGQFEVVSTAVSGTTDIVTADNSTFYWMVVEPTPP